VGERTRFFAGIRPLWTISNAAAQQIELWSHAQVDTYGLLQHDPRRRRSLQVLRVVPLMGGGTAFFALLANA